MTAAGSPLPGIGHGIPASFRAKWDWFSTRGML